VNSVQWCRGLLIHRKGPLTCSDVMGLTNVRSFGTLLVKIQAVCL
jgi:hypothetical protein